MDSESECSDTVLFDKTEILSVCLLSVCPSFMLLTRPRLPRLTYQLPNTINPLFSYFRFVITSLCSGQLAFCSRLKMKKWRKLEQHSTENHSTNNSVGRAADLHSGGHGFKSNWWTVFFPNIMLFAYKFFKIQLSYHCYFAFQERIKSGLEWN